MRPEAGTLERRPEVALLARVAEAREPCVVSARADSIDEGRDRLRAADRHDHHVLRAEVAAPQPRQRLDRDPVTDALDRHFDPLDQKPDDLLAGFKGVRKAFLEKSIMSVFVIPVVAIIMSLGFAMLALWTNHQRKSQLLEQLHRERMAAIEKGIELPPVNVEDVVISPSPNTANPARVLRSGVLLLAIGIVLYFAIDETGGRQSGALFGLIPAAVGLANLVYAAVLFNNARKADEAKASKRLPE